MSVRNQMVALLTAQPGMTAAQLREAMMAMGLTIGKNEPACTLNILRKQGRVRHDGEMPARRYYAVDGAPAPKVGGRKPGFKEAKAAAVEAGKAKAAAPRVAAAALPADIEREQLADTIHEHLVAGDGWHSAEEIAADLLEPRQAVALAISDLVKAGRVSRRADTTGRWVYRDKREGDMHVVHTAPEAKQEAHPAPAPEAVAAPVPATAITQSAEQVSSNGNLAPESCAVEVAGPVPTAPPTSISLGTVLERMRGALKDPEPVDFPYAIGLEIAAVEDLLGDACDAKLPHAAIKALVLAQGSLRRAVTALQQRAA